MTEKTDNKIENVVDEKSETKTIKEESSIKSEKDNTQSKSSVCPFLTKKDSNKSVKEDIKNDPLKNYEKDSIFSCNCNLFFLKDKLFEKRGTGKFFFLKNSNEMYTNLMIRDGLMLNGAHHIISPSEKCNLIKSNVYDHSYIWVAVDDKAYVEEKFKTKLTVFLIKLDNEEDFNEFKRVYEEGQSENKKKLESLKSNK
ncbi:YRB1 [Hepatospora eriocheir]|uniref:YRB1 n=1 Tax=Hepatospora eriocheir TaxID=1081669 RepID=A0A1X0QBG3_9MICR|nr:YRB1 [Hepatospora eriocheir]ORD98446.1 YRB1 [Hepatospora eriocheir]